MFGALSAGRDGRKAAELLLPLVSALLIDVPQEIEIAARKYISHENRFRSQGGRAQMEMPPSTGRTTPVM